MRVSSGGVWKTPSPRAGISTSLFSVSVFMRSTVGNRCRSWEALSLPLSSPTSSAVGATWLDDVGSTSEPALVAQHPLPRLVDPGVLRGDGESEPLVDPAGARVVLEHPQLRPVEALRPATVEDVGEQGGADAPALPGGFGRDEGDVQ